MSDRAPNASAPGPIRSLPSTLATSATAVIGSAAVCRTRPGSSPSLMIEAAGNGGLALVERRRGPRRPLRGRSGASAPLLAPRGLLPPGDLAGEGHADASPRTRRRAASNVLWAALDHHRRPCRGAHAVLARPAAGRRTSRRARTGRPACSVSRRLRPAHRLHRLPQRSRATTIAAARRTSDARRACFWPPSSCRRRVRTASDGSSASPVPSFPRGIHSHEGRAIDDDQPRRRRLFRTLQSAKPSTARARRHQRTTTGWSRLAAQAARDDQVHIDGRHDPPSGVDRPAADSRRRMRVHAPLRRPAQQDVGAAASWARRRRRRRDAAADQRLNDPFHAGRRGPRPTAMERTIGSWMRRRRSRALERFRPVRHMEKALEPR